MKATPKDKKLVTKIITESFLTNPSVNAVIKDDGRKRQRITALARYAYRMARRRNGVYLSSDLQGVAIVYRYNEKKISLIDYWDQAILAIKCIGLGRVPRVLKRESYLRKMKPRSGDFLYFWFFGVRKDSRGTGAAKELKNMIFNDSRIQNLPIYLETSIEQNRRVYERYGFKVYHTWNNQRDNQTFWFMKREPN